MLFSAVSIFVLRVAYPAGLIPDAIGGGRLAGVIGFWREGEREASTFVLKRRKRAVITREKFSDWVVAVAFGIGPALNTVVLQWTQTGDSERLIGMHGISIIMGSCQQAAVFERFEQEAAGARFGNAPKAGAADSSHDAGSVLRRDERQVV